MIGILTKLLSPIFTPMGVSASDLESYLTQLQGYVWAILAILLAVIVMMAMSTTVSCRPGVWASLVELSTAILQQSRL